MFAQALTDINQRLNDAKVRGLLEQYALIGGFAVSAWGIPRATQDVDFALALGSADPVTLSHHLNAEFQAGEPDDPLRGVYRLIFSTEDHDIPIQLILFPPHWTSLLIESVVVLSVLGCTIPVISWQTLILLKLYAGGPQDLIDAQHILDARQPSESEIRSIASLAVRVDLLSEWNRLIGDQKP